MNIHSLCVSLCLFVCVHVFRLHHSSRTMRTIVSLTHSRRQRSSGQREAEEAEEDAVGDRTDGHEHCRQTGEDVPPIPPFGLCASRAEHQQRQWFSLSLSLSLFSIHLSSLSLIL
jgi:hypothetical protein